MSIVRVYVNDPYAIGFYKRHFNLRHLKALTLTLDVSLSITWRKDIIQRSSPKNVTRYYTPKVIPQYQSHLGFPPRLNTSLNFRSRGFRWKAFEEQVATVRLGRKIHMNDIAGQKWCQSREDFYFFLFRKLLPQNLLQLKMRLLLLGRMDGLYTSSSSTKLCH